MSCRVLKLCIGVSLRLKTIRTKSRRGSLKPFKRNCRTASTPTSITFSALDDYNTNLMAVVKVTGNIGAATGKRFFLPGLFFQARAEHPFVAQDKRTTPVDVQYPKSQEDDVTYKLPAGFSIESGPQQANAAWPNHAILKITSTNTPDSARVVRVLVYNFALLGASDYPSLHDFYQKVATADQQQLVLTRAAVAKGN